MFGHAGSDSRLSRDLRLRVISGINRSANFESARLSYADEPRQLSYKQTGDAENSHESEEGYCRYKDVIHPKHRKRDHAAEYYAEAAERQQRYRPEHSGQLAGRNI
jgi:hypothetical protein